MMVSILYRGDLPLPGRARLLGGDDFVRFGVLGEHLLEARGAAFAERCFLCHHVHFVFEFIQAGAGLFSSDTCSTGNR